MDQFLDRDMERNFFNFASSCFHNKDEYVNFWGPCNAYFTVVTEYFTAGYCVAV